MVHHTAYPVSVELESHKNFKNSDTGAFREIYKIETPTITSASNTDIFIVTTVVVSPWSMPTEVNVWFCARASDVV